jgi:hypothetical protein
MRSRVGSDSARRHFNVENMGGITFFIGREVW